MWKKSIQQKSWSWSKAALMEFCPQYCARIATEIYDKWRVLSWLLTAFDVHKVLSRKCRRTMVKYYSFWETFNESSQCLLISPKEFLFFFSSIVKTRNTFLKWNISRILYILQLSDCPVFPPAFVQYLASPVQKSSKSPWQAFKSPAALSL